MKPKFIVHIKFLTFLFTLYEVGMLKFQIGVLL